MEFGQETRQGVACIGMAVGNVSSMRTPTEGDIEAGYQRLHRHPEPCRDLPEPPRFRGACLPHPTQFSTDFGATNGVAYRFKACIEKWIHPRDPPTHCVRHTALRTTLQTSGYHHPHLRFMSNTRINLS
jgi:hypothetical protein